MPIFDSRMEIVLGDPKPERVCHYKDCPNNRKYKGLNVKQCGKCKWIRYCCRECQVADWPEHKAVCTTERMLDIGAWQNKYAWLFRWAARETLCYHPDMNLTSTHALLVEVLRTDRLVAPTARPFLVDSVHVLPHGTVEAHWGVPGQHAVYTAADRARGAMLQAQGALGLAQVIFRIPGPNGTSMLFFQCFELPEHEYAARRDLGRHQVYALTKKVVNGDLPEVVVRILLTPGDLAGPPPYQPNGFGGSTPVGPPKPKRKMKDRGQEIMHA
ncbi:zinc finger MYND domain-containing protein [Phanerochaete sordida]|uniref:Zinc finger MYND domain-containing protein n=1 Tax=Phanerochaete sordida TaxID=48140 RepID=A0A9P3GI46_9APHY|nr:zinc finger MYND domain-containing protein [Phanerochaete sordida]